MADSLFEKAALLVKGISHGLLDRAIDTNSPDVLKQYLRELEDALRGTMQIEVDAEARDIGLRNADERPEQLDAMPVGQRKRLGRTFDIAHAG